MKNIKSFFKNNYKLVILFISMVVFLIILEDVIDEDIMKFDSSVYSFISKNLISDIMTPIAKFITNFGGTIWLISLTIFLLIITKNKKISIGILVNLITSALINYTLKQILHRPRPTECRIINESGYSFPSGHSMVSMAFYGFLIYLIYKNIKNKYIKFGLIGVIGILIISIGISRIYLGVHYTSDVVAGFLLAISYLIIYIKIWKTVSNVD